MGKPNTERDLHSALCTGSHKHEMPETLLCTTQHELVRVALEHIHYLSSEGNYTQIHLKIRDNNCERLSNYLVQCSMINLHKELERRCPNCFVRVGKSLLVRKEDITYINTSKGELHLIIQSEGVMGDELVVLQASTNSLKTLKKFLEEETSTLLIP